MKKYNLIHGNCRDVLTTLPSRSFDAVITDPPYPEIDRDYGRMTEKDWLELMTECVVPQCMRVLKPKGSAIFVLQSNTERTGRIRSWLLEFQLWCSKNYGIIQDLYWWNNTTLPSATSISGGLCRASVKACVWVGPEDCYRDQDSILIEESESNRNKRAEAKDKIEYRPSGHRVNNFKARNKSLERGGVTPFNLFVMGNTDNNRGENKHPANTPKRLCEIFVRYLCPPGGSILDPFSGGGTVGEAAIECGMTYTGIERLEKYHNMALENLEEASKNADVLKYKCQLPIAEPDAVVERYSL